MKYVFRRLLAGIVIIPAVAILYTLACGVLIALGAGQSASAQEYFQYGLVLGAIITIVFAYDAYRKGD